MQVCPHEHPDDIPSCTAAAACRSKQTMTGSSDAHMFSKKQIVCIAGHRQLSRIYEQMRSVLLVGASPKVCMSRPTNDVRPAVHIRTAVQQLRHASYQHNTDCSVASLICALAAAHLKLYLDVHEASRARGHAASSLRRLSTSLRHGTPLCRALQRPIWALSIQNPFRIFQIQRRTNKRQPLRRRIYTGLQALASQGFNLESQ